MRARSETSTVGALVLGATTMLALPACKPTPSARANETPASPRAAWCSPVRAGGPPRFVVVGVREGTISASYEAPMGFDASVSNVRTLSSLAMSSGGEMREEIADTSDRHPLPCTFTAVFSDKTCLLVATGKRNAHRQIMNGSPSAVAPPEVAPWRLLVDLLDGDQCVEERALHDEKVAVLVEGSHRDLRVVPFQLITGYSGGDGASGPLVGHDGRSLVAEIARWPRDEQARYARGPGFEARRTRARDLFWFTSREDARSPWSSRLRDGEGNHLRLTYVVEGVERESSEPVVLLREGEHLYWSHGQLR